jgi:hypothetical protein
MRKLKLALAFAATAALSFIITFAATGPGRSVPENSAADPVYPAAQPRPLPRAEKYRPRLTPEQLANPTFLQKYELALAAYDADLVNVARVRFPHLDEQLDWLDRAQQQREINNIDWMKPLTYPVQMNSSRAPMNSVTVVEEGAPSGSNSGARLVTHAPGVQGFVAAW